jgi:hypothetical protein
VGYDTFFRGEFKLNKRLSDAHAAYLRAFVEKRHVTYNDKAIETCSDPLRVAVGLPLGPGGTFFVGTSHEIDDANTPPPGVPGVWCRWEPNYENTAIVWDGSEKFYDYVEWLAWIVTHLLSPWGYVLSGTIEWRGDSADDYGSIVVTRNKISVRKGKRALGRARKVR